MTLVMGTVAITIDNDNMRLGVCMSIATILGMTVVRAIPAQTIIGLLTGQYTLHGGVIRWAAGTTNAGQIVAHLLPNSPLTSPLMMGAGLLRPMPLPPVGTLASLASAGLGLASISVGFANLWMTSKALQAARQAMHLAALNLAVTQSGFATLEQRIDSLEATLNEVARTTSAIYEFIQLEQRAELHLAIERLARMPLLRDRQVQIETMLAAEHTLSRLRIFYRERMAASRTINEAMAAEEYLVLAGLGAARCYAELGEMPMAQRLLAELHTEWQSQARRVVLEGLLGSQPERFLHRDFAEVLSVQDLAAILDFAHGTTRGIGWIDELRQNLDPWYCARVLNPIAERRMPTSTELEKAHEYEHGIVVPALVKLVARNQVLEGYISQYDLLAEHGMTPSMVEQELRALPAQTDPEGMVILVTPEAAERSWEAAMTGQDSDLLSQPGETGA
jgi:hypothetical protein